MNIINDKFILHTNDEKNYLFIEEDFIAKMMNKYYKYYKDKPFKITKFYFTKDILQFDFMCDYEFFSFCPSLKNQNGIIYFYSNEDIENSWQIINQSNFEGDIYLITNDGFISISNHETIYDINKMFNNMKF